MQYINLVRWLEDVVEGLGGTTFVARQELLPAPTSAFRSSVTTGFFKKNIREATSLDRVYHRH